MLRSFPLSVGIILLMFSCVLANIGQAKGFSISDIGQAEGFSISALNMVQRVGGAGWAKSENMVMVGHGQRAHAAGTAAMQKETGILVQYARTSGLGGATKILQNASVVAVQQQSIVAGRRYGLLEQGQNLTVGLDNVVHKTGGIGTAVSGQGFVGAQKQVIITPNGTGANYQVVGVTQSASVSGGPCSSVAVVSTLDVQMGQSQSVTGSYVPPKPKPPSYP